MLFCLSCLQQCTATLVPVAPSRAWLPCRHLSSCVSRGQVFRQCPPRSGKEFDKQDQCKETWTKRPLHTAALSASRLA